MPMDANVGVTPPTIVVMGVSGSGKTSLGEALATALGCPFQEGDALHPPENVAKMHAGIPLSDEDRAPWLDAVAGWVAGQASRGGVISCSALKRSYRDRLRLAGGAALPFVLLDPDRGVLEQRLAQRQGHFMPASLLGSQLDLLERPGPDERALVLRDPGSVAEACRQALDWIAGVR